MNIVEHIAQRVSRQAVAIISDDSELRYGELFDLVEAAAKQLKATGVLGGAGVPRIGLFCPNGIAHVVLALAIVRAGGCLVPVAGELAPQERDALDATTALHAIVIGPGCSWHRPLEGSVKIELPVFQAGVVLRAQRTPAFNEDELSSLEPAFIRFSSGTTGRSKGVVLSHRTLFDRINSANRRLKITSQDRVVWILPMAHHFAVSIMLYLLQGAATVLVSSHLAEDILRAARKHGGTVVYGAPFHHALLASEPSGLPWPTLRLAVSTAAALPVATAKAFDQRYGVPLSQALGIIEAGLPLLNTGAPREKPSSVGKPEPDFEVELRDESGAKVATGEAGELFLRGPGMFDAYLTPWRRRDEALVGGWFPSGDVATFDADGYLTLVGRRHSVINVGGMKCFPEEIEAVLCGHPEIAAARVVGKQHARFGSVPVAEIVPRNSAHPPETGSILAHCRNALARFKIPVEILFVESLPKTASGKIKR